MIHKIKQWLEPRLPHWIADWYRNKKFLYGYRGGKRTWSQEGEDILLTRWIGKDLGFYVDIGAHHPYRYSNTCLLYKFGWKGINVDPNPNSIGLFAATRKRDVNLCLGVGNAEAGSLIYHEFSDPAFNTFDENAALAVSSRAPSVRLLKTRGVEVVSLERLLEEWLPKGQGIDFLNIDVEGLDLDVVRSNNWEKFRPKVIAIEIQWVNLSELLQHQLVDFLREVDYELMSKLVNTVFFYDTRASEFRGGDVSVGS